MVLTGTRSEHWFSFPPTVVGGLGYPVCKMGPEGAKLPSPSLSFQRKRKRGNERISVVSYPKELFLKNLTVTHPLSLVAGKKLQKEKRQAWGSCSLSSFPLLDHILTYRHQR